MATEFPVTYAGRATLRDKRVEMSCTGVVGMLYYLAEMDSSMMEVGAAPAEPGWKPPETFALGPKEEVIDAEDDCELKPGLYAGGGADA